jgi:alpha-D-ribose 1-methylphosphonate 5-triphosphate synthase subunit PhnI
MDPEYTTLEAVFVPQEKVTWTLGYTHNLGNFESLRVDCQIESYKRDDETMKQASARVWSMVQDELLVKYKEAKENMI